MNGIVNEGIQLDTTPPGVIPWPADAVIVVAAVRGHERRADMEGVLDATCRRCFADLAADTRTFRAAEQLAARVTKPVEFFCVACAVLHKCPPPTIDHRNTPPGEEWEL